MRKDKKTLAKNEEGFAAIVIAISMILILSLITVGFAELMRHEQKAALDNHLSSQAYYAAETGVNDAKQAVAAGYSSTSTSKGCGPLPIGTTGAGAYLTSSNVGDPSSGVSYPCLLINTTPTSVVDALAPGQTKATEISSGSISGGVPDRITSILVSWQQNGNSNNTFRPAGSPHSLQATTSSAWNSTTGMVRVSLTPLEDAHLSSSDLISNTFTAFLYPGGAGAGTPGTVAYSPLDGNNGPIVDGRCNTNNLPSVLPGYCNVRITGLLDTDYLLTLTGLYDQSNVTTTAYIGSNTTTPIPIKNAQTLIDSTGKAQNVLRRIQVRISNSVTPPPDALEATTEICKQLQLPGTNACNP